MTSFLDYPEPNDDVATNARVAGKSLILARNELRSRVGDWLLNAQSDDDFAGRLSYIDDHVNSVVHRRLSRVSDGKSKLVRALYEEWKSTRGRLPLARK